jgi:hypothetical protein
MKKGDEFARRPFERHLVDEVRPGGLRLRELPGEVIGAEGDVVDAFPLLLEKLRDRALVARRLEQLEVDFAAGKEGRSHLLRFHFLATLAGQPEGLFVVGNALVERLHRDSKVVDFCDHKRLFWNLPG